MKVFVVKAVIETVVAAESEEEAREYFSNNCDVILREDGGIDAQMRDSEARELTVPGSWSGAMPWNDHDGKTVNQILAEQE